MTVVSVDSRTGRVLHEFAESSTADVAAAAARAVHAMPWLHERGAAGRAELLDALAAGLEARRDEVISVTDHETALGPTRLQGELARTCHQLRFLGDVAQEGSYLDVSIDHAGANAAGPVPDLRRTAVPVGPVAVFGAGNFPLALSTPGADTASALAAGCPVIVKAHGSHPGSAALVQDVFAAVLAERGAPVGVFQVVQGFAAGVSLVTEPSVAAVGFTGSVAGGRALFDRAASRPVPIPFYGELGSINPLVVTPAAAAERGADIGAGLATSMTLGTGQFCTRPGIFLIPSGRDGDTVVSALVAGLDAVAPAHMLSDTIRTAFDAGTTAVRDTPGISVVYGRESPDRQVTPLVVGLDAADLGGPVAAALAEEVFGPFGAVVRYSTTDDIAVALSHFPPALTGTLHIGAASDPAAARIAEALAGRSGRVIVDGYPTGLAVTWSMHHGGPYPASTSSATSVGADSIRRWTRPVVYQNAPQDLLPVELRDDTTTIPRRVDGIARPAAIIG